MTAIWRLVRFLWWCSQGLVGICRSLDAFLHKSIQTLPSSGFGEKMTSKCRVNLSMTLQSRLFAMAASLYIECVWFGIVVVWTHVFFFEGKTSKSRVHQINRSKKRHIDDNMRYHSPHYVLVCTSQAFSCREWISRSFRNKEKTSRLHKNLSTPPNK